MKKTITWLLVFLLALSVCLSAFAEPVAEPTPNAELLEDVDEWLYDEDEWASDDEDIVESELFADISEEGAEDLDEEDSMEDVLYSAMEVYSWFVLYPLDVDYDKPNEAGDRYQVLDERFNTMQSLKDFVSQYFCDEIVEDLFAMNVYTEENGFLYTVDEGREIDESIGETEFEVVEQTDNRMVYRVTVHYYDWNEDLNGQPVSDEVFDYVRELIDGEWRFTEFPFFW